MLYVILRNFVITADKKANLAYTLVNIFYYGIYAFIFLYLSIYMLEHGFDNSEIGVVMSSGFIFAAITQQILANFADKAKRITVCQILILGFIFIALINAGLLTMKGKNPVIGVLYCLQIVLIMGIQPCLNALNFQLQNYKYQMNFGVARSMGSVSYAVASSVIGQLLPILGTPMLQYGIIGLGICVILLLGAIDIRLKMVKSIRLPGSDDAAEKKKSISYIQFIRKYSRFMWFIAGSTLIYYCFATLNNFMFQVMQPLGGTSAEYGNVQGMKAFLELFPMILSLALASRFGIDRLIKISAFCFFLRSLTTMLAGSIAQIYASTLLQLTSYGVYAPITVYLVAELFDKEDSVKGQSLLTLSYALGCVIASAAGGFLLTSFGPKVLLAVSTAAAGIGTIIIIYALKVVNSSFKRKRIL
ncbi:MAG: MFS transporter [Clostridiales bacterium]|nr:MFS transporter [Clostridiales bacterium]